MHTLDLPIALVNLENGLDKGASLHLLYQIMAPCAHTRPGIIVINEACWRLPRHEPEREAVSLLSQLCGVRYEILLGSIERSDHPPAIVFDTDRFEYVAWSDPASDSHRWGHNTLTLVSRAAPNLAVRVIGAHFDYASGTRRLMEAETLASQVCRDSMPTLVAGDLNATASGPHLPQRDWTLVPPHKRHQKGRQLASGEATTDTRALDTLIGVWDEHNGIRVGGAGLHALAERDWEQRGRPDEPLASTTHTDQSLTIDWLLATEGIGLIPGTYQVWDGNPAHTDHKLITATITLRARA